MVIITTTFSTILSDVMGIYEFLYGDRTCGKDVSDGTAQSLTHSVYSIYIGPFIFNRSFTIFMTMEQSVCEMSWDKRIQVESLPWFFFLSSSFLACTGALTLLPFISEMNVCGLMIFMIVCSLAVILFSWESYFETKSEMMNESKDFKRLVISGHLLLFLVHLSDWSAHME